MWTGIPFGFFIALLALIGLCIGSFGNVLIARLPKGMSIAGRSRCPHCKATLKWFDLIPVLSFLLLKGKCRSCGKSISVRYPLIEITSCALFVAAYLQADSFVYGLLLGLALWSLLLIAVIDFETHLIPDLLTFIVGMGGLFFHLPEVSFFSPLIGALFFGGQWLVSRGAWLGSGDILLGIAIGVLLNDWKLMSLALMTAYIIGGIYAAWLLASKRAEQSRQVPFGPFLTLGTFVMVFFGEQIARFMLPW